MTNSKYFFYTQVLQAARSQLEQRNATAITTVNQNNAQCEQTRAVPASTWPPSKQIDYQRNASFSFHHHNQQAINNNSTAELRQLTASIERTIQSLQDAEYNGKMLSEEHILALQGLIAIFNNQRSQGSANVLNLKETADMLSLIERQIYGGTVAPSAAEPAPATYMSNCY